MTRDQPSVPLEHFIQAVQSQLDNAQVAMQLKARNLNLGLTFAIKDITLDLRAQVEFSGDEIRIRPAGAADKEASVFHLVFTAITRPMIEETALALGGETEESEPIEDLGEDLSAGERRRLEWLGVRTVSKLREMEKQGASRTVSRVTSVPVDRLRKALQRSSAPMVEHVSPVQRRPGDPADLPGLLRVRGRNLRGADLPRVTLAGEPVAVLKADETELLLAPQPHQWAGQLTVEPAPAIAAAVAFDLRAFAPPPAPAAAPPLPNGSGGHA